MTHIGSAWPTGRAAPWRAAALLLPLAACVSTEEGAARGHEGEAEAEAEGEGGSQCCPGARENELGVGRPCTSASACAGAAATLCPRELDPTAPDFCTLDCAQDAECGAGAVCSPQYAVCVPASCATDLCAGAGEGEAEGEPFEGEAEGEPGGNPEGCAVELEGPVNDMGLGTRCATSAECGGLEMDTCPRERYETAPDYCTRSCSCDSECGSDAICYTTAVGGRCAPAICYPGVAGAGC